MNVAVRYYSRGGNTKKIAEAIAEATGVEAKDCSAPVAEAVDWLFLGGSVYAFGLDDHTKNFITGLDPEKIKNVALFGTSAIVRTGNQGMAKLLHNKGIPVSMLRFDCPGAFLFMHSGRPNTGDLIKAADFAADVVKQWSRAGDRGTWERVRWKENVLAMQRPFRFDLTDYGDYHPCHKF